jgi:beta-lactam-binding protein with PASTA domain
VGDPVAINPLCPNPNRVAMQEPPAGSQVDGGSTVTIHPGEATSPTPSESPSP